MIVSLIRKLVVLAIGLPLTVFGAILIPLPGPGLIIMFIGLFILSLEFNWARKYVDEIKDRLGKIISSARARADSIGKE